MVPEDRELVRPDSSSTVGSVRSGMVVIPSSPARSIPRHQGDWSNSLHRCIQFGLGSPVRLTLDTGTVVSISTIVPYKRSGDAGCHLCCERLPTSAEVPSGEIDVHNIQADSLSRVSQILTTEWTMATDSLRPVFAKWGEPRIDLFATFANRRLVKFVSPYPDPRAEWTDAMSMPWDKKRGLLYAFPPFKMVPQVLQKIAQSPGVEVILIAQLQPAASWFPELTDLSQEDPIPLFVEGQDLLTQDIRTADGMTKTHHFRPSNLRAWKLSGPSWELRVIAGKLPTWCQGAYENLHNKCMNLIGQDSWRFVGRKDGTCFESEEVIILAPTWCTSSGTDYYPRRWYHIARLWLLCYVIGCMIRQPTRTSSYWSGLSDWNVRCNAESCLNGTFIWFYLLRPPFTSQSDEDGESSDEVPTLKWRTLKCVFLLALASARRRSYLHALSIASGRCVFARGNAQRQLVVSLLPEPGEESASDAGPCVDHGTGDCPLESDGTGENAMSRETVEALHTGLGKNPGGPSAHVHSLEPQHQRYHEEPHKPMDRGDCQGSLHSSWSSVWLCDTWGPSTVSFMGVQMSGGFTWHPVVLEVIWGLPEFVPARHGLYRWWHVDTGSSGGCTTRSGSRASSPTSIAYTICMQPLLRRS